VIFAGIKLKAEEKAYQPLEGDIIFQSLPATGLVKAIEGISGSPYSHCGVVLMNKGKPYVIQALVNVHLTHLDYYLKQSRDGKYYVYRLKEEFRTPEIMEKFRTALMGYLCSPYDIHYRMDDNYIYCSELIYKAYLKANNRKLGKLVELGKMNWKPYQSTIVKIEGKVPLERPMITPGNLAKAEELEMIFSFSR
jgi:hypothetical protein